MTRSRSSALDRLSTTAVEVPAWLYLEQTDHRPVRDLQRRLHGGHADAARRLDPPVGLLAAVRRPVPVHARRERDLSNSRDYDEFFEHYEFVVARAVPADDARRMTPFTAWTCPNAQHRQGRLRCTTSPATSSACTRSSASDYVARYHVWKEPLTVRNRTMTKALAHKTIVEDSSRCSVASRRLPARLPQAARTPSRSLTRTG